MSTNPANINTGTQDYSEVESKILNYLNGTTIQYLNDTKWYIFTCIQIYENGNERIDQLAILWDNDTSQYVIQARKIKGDTELPSNMHDIYSELNSVFTQQTQNP